VQDTVGAADYDELRQGVDDPLQIGEFLLQLHGGKIGPLPHGIEQSMPSSPCLSRSAPHVELVNLGAPVIYTTNCDDLIESTFRALGMPVDVVALADDVVQAGPDCTHVIKFHGTSDTRAPWCSANLRFSTASHSSRPSTSNSAPTCWFELRCSSAMATETRGFG
jgi:hypothetical protein